MKEESKLYNEIFKLLQNLKDEHYFDVVEMEQVASIINAVAKSPQDVRMYFYKGVSIMAETIVVMLGEKAEEIKKELYKKNDDDKGGNILN